MAAKVWPGVAGTAGRAGGYALPDAVREGGPSLLPDGAGEGLPPGCDGAGRARGSVLRVGAMRGRERPTWMQEGGTASGCPPFLVSAARGVVQAAVPPGPG